MDVNAYNVFHQEFPLLIGFVIHYSLLLLCALIFLSALRLEAYLFVLLFIP